MMKIILFSLQLVVFLLFTQIVYAQPVANVPGHARCAVCGMKVAKYKSWQAQLKSETQGVLFFDGVKDMMAYYHAPQMFGGKANEKINNLYVTDYYTGQWIDGKTAFFVIGSDVLGPMGHEFIPFEAEPAANSFFEDHGGKEVLSFADITTDLVQEKRGGHMMKGGKKHKK